MTRLTAVDLADVPEVQDFLDDLGLGAFAGGDLEALLGRNDNWAGSTTTGARVFVKRVGGPSGEEALRRFRRILAFEELAERSGAPVRRPPTLGNDAERRLLAFELLEDVRTGAELAAEDAFDGPLAREAGRVVGVVHGLDPRPAGVRLDTDPHPLPPLGLLQALSVGGFLDASAAELEAWSVLQSDLALGEALVGLRRREREAPCVPIHADLRLDQFLVDADGTLFLTDWEEFRLGDAARDVGGIAGEWLHRAVLGIAATADPSVPDLEPSHDAIVARGVEELDRVRPRIAAFWAGYRETRPAADAELAERATAFAGWHLLDRMLASARERGRLMAVERAAAGIGRTALLDPARFTAALGLDEPA
jgi:hypothetical protein